MLKKALVLVVAGGLFFCSSCEYQVPTSITVGAGPVFNIRGSGRLVEFTVYAPQVGQHVAAPNSDLALVVWQIKASGDYSRVQDGRLIYGKTPAEYRQIMPNQPQTAASLPVGMVYSFYALPADAQPLGGYFYMGETGPVQIRVPDLCLTLKDGREVRVKCGTSRPYEEPKELEEMVRKNRISP